MDFTSDAPLPTSAGSAVPPRHRIRLLARRYLQPGPCLLVLSLLLPTVVFGLAGWQNRRDLFRQAELRIHRTLRTLTEQAVKVFETQALVIDQVNERLRSVDWNRESDRADLHEMLEGLQSNLDHITTITITDADGRLRASGRIHPADQGLSFADRDWFQALKKSDQKLPFVSRATLGRQSGRHVFNIARRVRSRDGSFQGVIAISVDRAYFEEFYRGIEAQPGSLVLLVRNDGEILARQPAIDALSLPPAASFFASLRLPPGALFEFTSALDGEPRLLSYRKIGDYPVSIGLGLSRQRLLAVWRHNLFTYGLLAVGTAVALLAMSALVLRQMSREHLAVQQWQTAAAKLRAEAAERERVEAHLRQSQKMEAVGQLTSGIAHDFNNMLGTIIGSLDLLKLRLKRQSAWDDGIKRYVESAMEGAWRAASLTQRLLAFSRKQVLSPRQLDVNELVAGMSDLIRRTISEDVRIQFDLAEHVWPTHADPNQLENAVLNLVVNARDAMPHGGCLTVKTRNCQGAAPVTDAQPADPYAAGAPDDCIMLAIQDTGSGMTPDVLSRAFDPFFTTKEVGKGTGLGLSQVQGFVEQSRGYVKVVSEVDRGTTVEIYLPRLTEAASLTAQAADPRFAGTASAGASPQEKAPRRHGAIGSGQTVLVVEDDSQLRKVSGDAFRELGFTVLEASGAREALHILGVERNVKLLFTDVVMPDVNGAQLAAEVRRTRPEIKVLFTTGYTQEALVKDARMDHTADLIAKPFTLAELEARVADVVDRDVVVWG